MSAAQAALNKGADKRKALLAANLVAWVAQGLYTVSPIDMIPDIVPLIGFADDLLGLFVTLAFTLYTLSLLWQHGPRGLLPGNAGREHREGVIDIEPEPPARPQGTPEIPGYEPLSIPQIRSL